MSCAPSPTTVNRLNPTDIEFTLVRTLNPSLRLVG